MKLMRPKMKQVCSINKANFIRNNVLIKIEAKAKEDEDEKNRKALEELRSRDLPFIDTLERIKRIKAGIVS